jgi:hypothetical protein
MEVFQIFYLHLTKLLSRAIILVASGLPLKKKTFEKQVSCLRGLCLYMCYYHPTLTNIVAIRSND